MEKMRGRCYLREGTADALCIASLLQRHRGCPQTSPPADPTRVLGHPHQCPGTLAAPQRTTAESPMPNNPPVPAGHSCWNSLSVSLSCSHEHWQPSGLAPVPCSSPWGWVPPKLGRDSPWQQTARPGSVCQGTAAPICSPRALCTPLAAHLPPHMAEAERRQSSRRRKGRRASPAIAAPWAHSPAWCQCPTAAGLVSAHLTALTHSSHLSCLLQNLLPPLFPTFCVCFLFLSLISSTHCCWEPCSPGHTPNIPTATPSPITPPRQLGSVGPTTFAHEEHLMPQKKRGCQECPPSGHPQGPPAAREHPEGANISW